jgi:hypothetical protein
VLCLGQLLKSILLAAFHRTPCQCPGSRWSHPVDCAGTLPRWRTFVVCKIARLINPAKGAGYVIQSEQSCPTKIASKSERESHAGHSRFKSTRPARASRPAQIILAVPRFGLVVPSRIPANVVGRGVGRRLTSITMPPRGLDAAEHVGRVIVMGGRHMLADMQTEEGHANH